jgi:hypothetical protein
MVADPLPAPGPPFAVGDEVAFFPAEIATPEDPGWFRWDYAIIDDINEAARSFGFHFLSKPGVRYAQGFENIVRRTPRYDRWREAAERAVADAGDWYDDPKARELWVEVLAEHPMHGGEEFPHPAVAERRARDIQRR